MVVPIFNTHCSVHKFDRINEFGPGTAFKTKVDNYLNHTLFNRGSLEQQGPAITTVKQATEHPLVAALDLANNDLGKWILSTKSEAARELKVPVKEPDWFTTHRVWANRLFTGSSSKTHHHGGAGCHMVAVFYYEAPKDSGDLIFINAEDTNEELVRRPIDSYAPEQIIRLTPEPGMLICHSPWIPHAVLEHKASGPRTSFIFEFMFMDMPIYTLTHPTY
jgi:hypothetical protein